MVRKVACCFLCKQICGIISLATTTALIKLVNVARIMTVRENYREPFELFLSKQVAQLSKVQNFSLMCYKDKPEQNLLCCKCNSSNIFLLFNYLKSQKGVVAQTNVYSFNMLDFDNITKHQFLECSNKFQETNNKGWFHLRDPGLDVSQQILY